MNQDTMNNYIDNQQNQNSTQDDTNSKEVVNEIKKIKKSSMNSTLLYVSFFSLSIQYSNISLDNIHGGHNIQLK
jgi:GTP-dependent phosphoenolpyruvate carboxykinase